MEWKGQADWLASPEVDWRVNGAKAGSVKAFGPLSFVKVAGAGHMVPMVGPGLRPSRGGAIVRHAWGNQLSEESSPPTIVRPN